MAKKPFNPVEKTAMYQKMTTDRGYGFFSDKAVAIQREKNENSGADVNKLRDLAKKHADEYMKVVNDPSHPEHVAQRKEYYSLYDGDRKNIEDAKFSALCDMVDFAPLPQRNTAYERKVLEPKSKRPTADEARDHKVFTDLVKAKWDALGYTADKEVIDEYEREYGNVASSSDDDRGARNMSNIMNKLSEKHSATEK